MSKNKTIPIQVVVSIPRAGEFIATIQLDPSQLPPFGPNAHSAAVGRDVEALATDRAASKVRVKPLKGEIQRVVKLLRSKK